MGLSTRLLRTAAAFPRVSDPREREQPQQASVYFTDWSQSDTPLLLQYSTGILAPPWYNVEQQKDVNARRHWEIILEGGCYIVVPFK